MERLTQREVDDRAKLNRREDIKYKLEDVVTKLNSLLNLEAEGELEQRDYSYLRKEFTDEELDTPHKNFK